MALRGAVIDLDGTVYRGDSLLPGARDAVDRLRAAGMDLLFVSNNPTKSGSAYVDRLREFGLNVRPGEACSAGDATARFLREHHATDRIMLVGSEGLRAQFRDTGLTLAADPAETGVFVGSWTPEFGYDDMVTALRAVGPDTPFFGTDPDRTVPGEDGQVIPGSGAVVNALAGTLEREPDAFMGKPSDPTLSLVRDRLPVPPEECLVVGDRPGTDLALGERAGMTTALVLTGVADRSDVAESDVDPDYVLDSLADIDEILAGGR